MPADTKLYLYLDPGGLMARAPSTFEPDQFAGWVPHQQITYLWPSGPWFRLFDLVGVPDWIAHRLWIATVMFAAGTGVWWAVRRIGLAGSAALAAAVTYQVSPFLLPYVSRTSVLLLPWAGLGWIVGLVIVAGHRTARPPEDGTGEWPAWRRRLVGWREPALIALVVVTVGSANATALALIVPAPVLWLVHAAWSGSIRWRAALAVAARTAVACLAVSLWWIAMLVVQSRHGAPVLSYSETLADVSRNSTGSEVMRSLGYWLFYVRDPFGPTTTSSLDYLASTRAIAVSYVVTLVGLAGIALTSWSGRRFAAMLVFVGAVLSVGVHPIGSPSPLMSLVANDDESGIALALRSSTRALPLLALGLAIGIGSLLAAAPTSNIRRPSLPTVRTVAAAGAVVLVLVNLPSLWRFDLVDPAIDRDQDPPAAWTDAAQALDDVGADPPARVLQLPGAEFGAFRWGYTVDQPLVGMSDHRLVTRDLLPLGEAGAMDLLYALDDRFQEGTAEVASVAPVARLLGADTVWLANDSEFERFRTARPEIVADLLGSGSTPGLGPVEEFGTPRPNVPTVPMVEPVALADDRIGRPLAPVALVGVDDPIGIARTKTDEVIVAGSGDGVVDAAAAGLLSGHELLRYSASMTAEDRQAAVDAGIPLIVTDSNRDRAHHWRGSQDVHGHTEPGGPDDDVLVPTNADQRLAVFPTDDPVLQTVAIQDGPVRAIASGYGEPFAYLPEHRAAMAIDGDPTTAWLVGGHADPVGERIRLDLAEPATELIARQPLPGPGGRRITAVDVRLDDGPPETFVLDEESTSPGGQRLAVSGAEASIEIEIRSVSEGDPARAASRAAVGFAELDVGLDPTTEWIRPPRATLEGVDGPLAIVLSRLRVDPLDRWRADPESELRRRVTLTDQRALIARVVLRLDRRAADPLVAELAGIEPAATASADRRLTGTAAHGGPAAVDGDETTAWISPIDGALGATLVLPTDGELGPELTLVQPTGGLDTITAVTVADGRTSYELAVPEPDTAGRSLVELPGPVGNGPVTLTVAGVAGRTTIDRRFGDVVGLPVAIAEIEAAGIDAIPLDRSAVVDGDCREDLLELDGRPLPLTFSSTLGALLDGQAVEATVCGGPIDLGPGEHDLRSVGRPRGLTVDRVVLTDGIDAARPRTATPVRVERDDAREREYTVGPCPDGCWLVHGEGFNDAWSATAAGDSLGRPTMVDGGFNGWWIEPTGEPVEVTVRWTAQRPVTLGIAASLLAVLACLTIVAATWRDRRVASEARTPTYRWRRPADPNRRALETGAALVIASAVCIGPIWGLAGAAVAGTAALIGRATRHPLAGRVFELVALAVTIGVAIAVVVIVRRDRPLPTAGWTEAVAHLNGAALFAITCLAAGTLLPDRRPT